MRFFSFLSVAVFSHVSIVRSAPTVRELATFPGFIENIAVRANGHLLLTSLQDGTIYTIDPSAPQPSPTVLQVFPNVTGLSGITEVEPDLFVTLAGNWSLTAGRAALGSSSVWTLDLRGGSPKIQQIVTIPQSAGLNGAATVPGSRDCVLASDSFAGVVYRIELAQRSYSVAIDNAAFKPTGTQIGINGIRVFGNDLYFANSGQGILGRLPISTSGTAAGAVMILGTTTNTSSSTQFDDFAIGKTGNAWVATHPSSVILVGRNGGQTTFVNGTTTPYPTSAQFGRGLGQDSVLYVTTNEIGTTSVAGGVVAIDTSAVRPLKC